MLMSPRVLNASSVSSSARRKAKWVSAAVAALCCLSITSSFAAKSLPVEVLIREDIDRTRIILYLTQEEIRSIPKWQPGEGNPPLAMNDAINKLLAWISKKPAYQGGKIQEIEFKLLNAPHNTQRWYYLANVKTPDHGPLSAHYFAILADGSILPAIQEPQAIK